MRWQCRMAPSLGSLENTPENAWGTKPYTNRKEPTVFFGLYDLRDYIALFRHRGKKAVLWAGGDIENLIRGFMLNDGKLKWVSRILCPLSGAFIKKLAQIPSFVENEAEWTKLAKLGIRSTIAPSFLGKIEDFPICYKPAERPNVFISGHPGREEEYGFDFVVEIAGRVPECDFHLYGADLPIQLRLSQSNIISHGKVPKEQFNREIRNYQCGFRPNTSDGFSEILAKSALMGQWPISRIQYPLIDHYNYHPPFHPEELIYLLTGLKHKRAINHRAANYYRLALNKYPWTME